MSRSNSPLARFCLALPLVRNRASLAIHAVYAALRRRRRVAAAVGLAALPLAALLVWLALAPCPHPLEGVPFSRMVLDKRGGIMRVSLAADQKYRIRTRLADIPPAAVDTVLRYEDRYFWHHPGINPLSLFRAAAGIVAGGRRMGGSTITMQVARLSVGLETGKMRAKLQQMLLALQLEWHYSKQEILEAYFNLAPYGGNVEGLGAAAVCYFHKTAAQLAPAESAALMSKPAINSGRAGKSTSLSSSVMSTVEG